MLKKHLLPRFGDRLLSDVTRQEIQGYVAHLTQAGYAPKSIYHIHDVLSAVLRTAVKWGHLQQNPAQGVDLPTLTAGAFVVEAASEVVLSEKFPPKAQVGEAEAHADRLPCSTPSRSGSCS